MFPLYRLKRSRSRIVPVLLLCACAPGWAQSTAQQDRPIGITSPPGQVLTAREKQAVVAALLANSSVIEQTRGRKIRAIRIRHGFVATSANGGKPEEYRASVVLFDYTTGKATEYGLDPGTGELLSQAPLRGRPQASEEEIQLALRIVRRDPALARLASFPDSIAGGYVVDAPADRPASHRYVQVRLFSKDFARTLRVVVVDLSDETIASSTPD